MKRFFSYLVVFLMLLYDWRFLNQVIELQPIVYFLKLLIPILLFSCILSRRATLPKFSYIPYYLIFYGSAVLLALLSAIIADNAILSLVQWFKLLLNYLDAAAILLFLVNSSDFGMEVGKIMVGLAIITFIQFFILLILFQFNLQGKPFSIAQGVVYGPWGLLGSQGAMMHFNGAHFLRLTGYWYEPSNASGFMFATAFLSGWIYRKEKKRFWWLAMWLCIMGGLLALSNAGYLALGAAIMAYSGYFVLKKRRSTTLLFHTIIIVMGVFIFVGALGGRWYVVSNHVSNPTIRAIFGARAATEDRTLSLDQVTGSRIGLAQENFVLLLKKPFGIGPQISGLNKDNTSFQTASASAPVLWLVYTGIFGLLFILLALFQVVRLYFSRYMNQTVLYTFCAWIASTVQQMCYGTWDSPFYAFLTGLVFVEALNSSFRTRISKITKITKIRR